MAAIKGRKDIGIICPYTWVFVLMLYRLIQLALDLFTRGPVAYTNLRRTLRLPHPKHLQSYKNLVKQKPGIVHENLHWMALEAKRRNLSKRGREGFIIFDKVSIQVCFY